MSTAAERILTQATTPPVPMDHNAKMKLRAAAFRATKVYPGIVGQFITQELLDWEQFGYCVSQSGRTQQLVDHIMAAPIAKVAPPTAA